MIKNKPSLKDWDQMSANESTREVRLQSLKDAIEAGTYRLDNRVLADSLIDNLLQEQWERLKLKKH
jgi:anti-sigma28 factor (negative regulator of flagellin synthesis)